MRAALVIVAVVAVVVLLGWVTFSSRDGRPSATVETEVIREDSRSAAEATERAAESAAEKGEHLIGEIRRTDVDIEVRREPVNE